MDPEAGRRIGHYEILEHLGDGGMGAVYKALDSRFGRSVALKVLHRHLARNPEVVERFANEAVIQARLNHPNIATVFDFISEGGVVAMAMEYIDGVTLEQLLDGSPGRRLDAPHAVRLMDQILSGVGTAHANGLVHRDLKPSNVMVRTVSGTEFVKVMDFGIAKVLGAERLRTATSAKMGTLAYMSPEQLRSPRAVDARADLYSLGIVMYEMLTGRLPWDSDSDSEYDLMQAIVSFPVTAAGMSPPMAAVVLRATEKVPAMRFSHAEEMRLALHAGGQPRGVGANSPPLGEARAIPLVEHSGAAGSQRAERAPSSRRRWVSAALLSVVVVAGAAGWLYWTSPRGREIPSVAAALRSGQTDAGKSDRTLVEDQAGVLSGDDVLVLEQRLRDFDDPHRGQIAVHIVRSIGDEPLEAYSRQLFEGRRIGYPNRNGIGILIVVDERKIRIEVGRGLEGVLTNEVCSDVISREMVPHFRAARYADGLNAAVDAIARRLDTGVYR